MKEYLKIRVDEKTACIIKKETGIISSKVGKEHYALFDIELPLDNEYWEQIRNICLNSNSILKLGFLGKSKSSKDNFGEIIPSLPSSKHVGYILISHYKIYSKAELNQAEFFNLDVPVRVTLDRNQDQESEIYNFSNECSICRFGWEQINDLIFENKSLKSAFPFFRVFARNEFIISKDIKDLLENLKINGVEFRQIRDLKTNSVFDSWYQLIIKNILGPLDKKTRFGYDPIYKDPKDAGACPRGHTKGLNLISELFIDSKYLNGIDIAQTSELRGGVASIQLPIPFLLISRRLYENLISFFPKNKFRYDIVNKV